MMTAELLKRSILNMAFSGKLVDQRNNEESPVGILHHLTSNNSKNKRVIQIVRKQDGLHYSSEKNRMVCVEEDLLFDIPSTWEWTSLKNVSFVLYGFPFDSAKFNDVEDGTPLIRIRDVLPGFTKTYTTEKCSDEYIIENGDMLVGMDGNFNVNFWNGGTAYLNQRVCRIKAREEILDQKYLSYYLPLEFDRISRKVSYVTVRHLSDKHLSSLFIPIPPLAEQKRIVAKIEELMPLLEQYAASSTKLNTLNASFPEMMKKSILQEAVQGKLVPQDPNDEPASLLLKKIAEEKKRLIKEGKIKKQKPLPEITEDEIPFEIPESWEWVRLGDIYTMSNGIAKRAGTTGEFIGVLRLADLSEGVIDTSSIRKIMLTEKEQQAYLLKRNDLIMIRVNGSKGKVGTAFVYDHIEKTAYCDHLFRARSVGEDICPEYIALVFNTTIIRNTFKNEIKTTAGQNTISQESMKNVLIPLPPMCEQERIVDRVCEVLPSISLLRE